MAGKLVAGIKWANHEIREISHGLFPLQIKSKDLIPALRSLAAQTNAMGNVECTFDGYSATGVVDDFTATHLYRIAQEAVTNSLKHAHARHLWLRLTGNASQLVLQVSDDGIGVGERPVAGGMGMKSMEYRAHRINGILKLGSTEAGGACLTCTVPTRASRATRPTDF